MAWRLGADRSLEVRDLGDWDGQEAEDSIFDLAGFDTDDWDPQLARRGFLFYDTENQDIKGGYSFPFAQAENGELVASLRGLQTANSFLSRGIQEGNLRVPNTVARRGQELVVRLLRDYEDERSLKKWNDSLTNLLSEWE